jgi:hypothetical protein
MTLLTEGTKITYRNNAGRTKTSVIDFADDDIKNGRPGYELTDGTWCYAEMVIRAHR